MAKEVESFTLSQFREALPKKTRPDGTTYSVFEDEFVKSGEWCFAYAFTAKLRIVVRSSVSSISGVSNASGKDSIRIIVERRKSCGNWYAIAKGPDSLTQRTPGWEKRLREKVTDVYAIWRRVTDDFDDEENLRVSKKPHSFNRVFAVHRKTNAFRWLS